MTRLAVVIPVLDEAATLPALLADLAIQSGLELQVIVADGGSTDASAALAEAAGARVVHATRGRGAQMNAGAAVASADWLLFLHADSRLPHARLLAEALAHLQAQAEPARCAGHFALRFADVPAGHAFVFQVLEAKSGLNRRQTINGDQGFLLPADWFRELGGFDERLPYLEDQRLAAKVFASGRWHLLPGWLQTSARRFVSEGTRERLVTMALIMGLEAAGEHDLLARLPGLYAVQRDAGAQRTTALLRAVRQALWSTRWRVLFGTLWRGGRFVRANAWQLAFHRDVRREGRDAARRHPSLDRFERRWAPWLDNLVGDTLGTLLLTAWLFAWLPLVMRRRI